MINIIKNLRDDAVRNRHPGTFAWLLHRLTGLVLVFYLGLHLVVLSSEYLFGQGTFNLLMGSFERPLFKLLEVGLIGVIGFHLINGLRIMIADFLQLTRAQRLLFWLGMIILGMVLAITLVKFLPHII